MLAVVVDVLLGSSAMLEDVVIVPMVNDKDTAGLQHASEVLEALFMIPVFQKSINQSMLIGNLPEISMIIQQMRK